MLYEVNHYKIEQDIVESRLDFEIMYQNYTKEAKISYNFILRDLGDNNELYEIELAINKVLINLIHKLAKD